MTSTVAPLLGGLFLVLAAGALLRAVAGMGQREADTLNKIIMDVTMPALLLGVLAKRALEWRAPTALLSSTVALVVAALLGLVVARVLRADRRAQGSALLTAAFCNTGFLGFPLLLALFPGDAAASSTAILVDTFCTTLLLWTVGLAAAESFGDAGGGDLRARLKVTARVFARPLSAALVGGIVLHALHLELPPFLDGALDALGRCTSPLVFLALGLQLDAKAIAGRAPLVIAVTALKLFASPLVALACVRVLHVAEPAASVVVLQAAMPSALASVIVAARSGCDRPVAAGVATLSTVLCVASLPAIGAVIDATR